MKTNIIITFILIWWLTLTFPAYGSDRSSIIQPTVGKKMPDFVLSDVRNFNKKQLSLADFKGKWVFLDFWTLTCKSCIESFAKINSFQKQFSSNTQFLFVGKKDKRYNKGIERVYERISERLKLELPSAFDSVLFEQWEIKSVPHIYIIDPTGVVQFITDGRDITSEKIHLLLSGHEVSFYPKEDLAIDRPVFDIGKYYRSDKLLYSSMLTKWSGEKQVTGYEIDRYVSLAEAVRKGGWMVVMAPLFELYMYGYFGRIWWSPHDTTYYGKVYAFPLLEVRDSSDFKFDYNFNIGKGLYNLYLKLPSQHVNQDFMMAEIQKSLNSVFGYKVSMERREMPVWRLIAESSAEYKLKTKGGDIFFSGGNVVTGFTVKNYNIKKFLALVTANLPNEQRIAFVDESGIVVNIDATIDTDMTNFESVQSALKRYGLRLVKGAKEMLVLVIKDP